jgi:membrane-associated PAP2 superfamily phosphatase
MGSDKDEWPDWVKYLLAIAIVMGFMLVIGAHKDGSKFAPEPTGKEWTEMP